MFFVFSWKGRMTSPSIKSGDKKSPEKRSAAAEEKPEEQQQEQEAVEAESLLDKIDVLGVLRVFRLSNMLARQSC